jgi:hypothetical protein
MKEMNKITIKTSMHVGKHIIQNSIVEELIIIQL